MPGTNDAKRELRRAMRAIRRDSSVSDPVRSAAIVSRIEALPEVRDARTVMLFAAVPGEPDLRALGDRLRTRGALAVAPRPVPGASFPTSAEEIDVVLVPGLAFTRDGRRLGQGGGWYDRFLARVRPDCATVGVCFDEQLVDEVPVEPHDVVMRIVVTPTTIHRRPDADDPGASAPGSSTRGDG